MECIEEELEQFPQADRDDVVILFSAHSLPMKVCITAVHARLLFKELTFPIFLQLDRPFM